MSFFSKLKNMMLPSDPEPKTPLQQPQSVAQPEKPVQAQSAAPRAGQAARQADTNNVFDNSAMIIDRICTVLRPLAGGEGSEDLTLWVKADNLVLQHLVSSTKFAERLSMELLENRLDQFARGKLMIESGPVPKGIQAPTILPGQLFLSFGKYVKPKAPVLARAYLHLIEGSGQALTPDLELNPGEAATKVWHIGRGMIHRGSQSVRRNAYIVNDQNPTAQTGIVSHAHCDIVYKQGAFYLQACPGGCRAEGGSATKILDATTERLTELHSTTLLYPLHPGDIIELSKTILIQFSDK